MWFKGSCFFRNFPHWGVCSAVLGPCQGCPVRRAALQAGAMRQQWHCGAEARPSLSLGTRQPCTLVGTGMLAAHTTLPCCFLILACQEWGKMWCSTWKRGRGKEEILDLEKTSFLLPVSHGRVTFPGRSRGHDNSLFPMQPKSGVLITCGLIPEHLPQNQDVVLAKLQPGLSGQHPFHRSQRSKKFMRWTA